MEQIKLKYIAESFTTAIKQEEVHEKGKYEVYGASGFVGYLDEFGCDTDYLGIVKDGAGVGRINFYPKNTSLLGTMAYILPIDNNITDIKFLKYSIEAMELGKTSGDRATIPHIYFSKYGNNYVYKYPLETQQKIVSAIDSKTIKIDSLIANEEKQIEKLKSYKQSLITETVTKGLDKNAKMKDSGVEWIGEIPEGWECRKLKTLVTDIGDIDHYMPESVINGFPYVMTGDLKSNVSEIDFEKCKMVSKEEFDKLSKKIKAEKGDLIFARYATIGTVCFVDIDKEFLVSYSCVVIKIKKDELFGKYLNYYIQSNSFLEEAKKYTNSNTQGNVGISSLNEMLITLPELKKQNEIINFLDEKCTQIDKLISLKESKIEKLNAYKKSLIYEYVTGKKEA